MINSIDEKDNLRSDDKIIKFHHHKTVKLHHDKIDKNIMSMNFVEEKLRENTEETIKILRRIKYWEMHAGKYEKIVFKITNKDQLLVDKLLSM